MEPTKPLSENVILAYFEKKKIHSIHISNFIIEKLPEIRACIKQILTFKTLKINKFLFQLRYGLAIKLFSLIVIFLVFPTYGVYVYDIYGYYLMGPN